MPRTNNAESLNQPPPYEDVDLFASDRPLRDAVAANGAGSEASALSAFGRHWGSAEMGGAGAPRQSTSAAIAWRRR